MFKVINYFFLLTILFLSCKENTNNEFEKPISSSLNDAVEKPISKTFSFDMGKETHTIVLDFSEDLLQHFEKAPKVFTYKGNQAPKNKEASFYNIFLKDKKDEPILIQLLGKLKKIDPKMSHEQLMELAVAFVQGAIQYDWDRYHKINNSVHYPYETLFTQKGVCSDKSLLLSKLLVLLQYENILFTFEKANHMAVGLKVGNSFGNFNTNFAFIETTNYTNIGIVPDKYVGGVKLSNDFNLIRPANNGTRSFSNIDLYKTKEQTQIKKYGVRYISASAKEKILIEDMVTLNEKVESLKSLLEKNNCEGSVSKTQYETCDKLVEELNEKVKKYNDLVKKYNLLNEQITS